MDKLYRFLHIDFDAQEFQGENVYVLGAVVRRRLRDLGASKKQINEFTEEFSASESYRAAFEVVGRWFKIDPPLEEWWGEES